MSVCGTPRPIRILGTGVARPERQVDSREIDARLGLPPGTVQRRSGVRVRYVETQRSAAALAAEAARHALDAAGLTLADIDAIVASSGSMDQAMPCNAALIHHELGLGDRGVPAFDINASCLGFVAAIDTLSWAVLGGRFRRVLIVSADIASCALDWRDLGSSAIFGDGAGAAVLAATDDPASSTLGAGQGATRGATLGSAPWSAPGSAQGPTPGSTLGSAPRSAPGSAQGPTPGATLGSTPRFAPGSTQGPTPGSALLASAFATYSDGAHLCEIPAGGSRHHPSRATGDYVALAQFRMDGAAVFRLVARHIDGFVTSLLRAAGLARDEVTLLVPHQASHLGLRHVTRQLGFGRERTIDIYATHGNQVSASLPSALHAAICSGRLARGDTALLLGTGAGVSLGGLVLRY